MLRLLLLRHAKSDWSGKLGDHERPLAPRGRKAASRMGAYMRARGYEPDLALCSTAVRARETLAFLLPQFSRAPRVEYDHGLYLAEPPRLLTAIRDAPQNGTALLLVGHNPGLEQLAAALIRPQPDATAKRREDELAEKFTTAALAVIDFDVAEWSAVAPGSGSLSDFVRPRDLKGAGKDE